MKSTLLHEFLIGPFALACVAAVFIAVALEAPEDAAPARAALTASPTP
jgi:hypothetical protein